MRKKLIGFFFIAGKELSRQLDNWLSKAELVHGPARAIIAPHAGYQYCGACSAHAYRQVSPHVVRRVLVLGPSHHVRLAGCAITSATRLRTPFYDLHVDQACCAELEATGHFERMSLLVDEAEHSIEMHLPFIAKVVHYIFINFILNFFLIFLFIFLFLGDGRQQFSNCSNYGRITFS